LKNEVKEIIITGGPCSGKTKGIDFVKKKLEEMGWRVFAAREKATDVILGGVRDLQELAKKDPQKYLELQKSILQWQLDDAKNIRNLADIFKDEPRVILYDRGPQDNKAYVPEGVFDGFLKELGLSARETCFDFDAVIYMVTAADGAERYYNLANTARSEKDLQDVRDLDARTLAAYIGHPHLYIIDNSTDWNGKLERLFKAVLRVLGIPEPLEIERKFLVEGFCDEIIPAPFGIEMIDQIYVDIPDKGFGGLSGKSRIREVARNGCPDFYYLAQKSGGASLVRGEREFDIRGQDFDFLMRYARSNRMPIVKIRYYFVYKYQYFSLDFFVDPSWARGLYLLEIELLDENDKVELPHFLNIVKEVTGDPEYTNSAIAKKR